jgi:hypothetical protein
MLHEEDNGVHVYFILYSKLFYERINLYYLQKKQISQPKAFPLVFCRLAQFLTGTLTVKKTFSVYQLINMKIGKQ